MKLNILYEDNHVIVVEKKPGILSQKDETNDPDMITLIKEYLKEKYHKPGEVYLGMVHRLDRMVGGVMVFAKTSKAAKRLNQEMKKRTFIKKYCALVWGNPPKEGILIDYIYKNDEVPKAEIVDENHSNAKKAILSYKKVETIKYLNKELSLVDITLETGRYHQIRCQFSSRGYPVYGDQKYGRKFNKKGIILGLWSYSLSFIHPIKKELMTFTVCPKSQIWQKFNTNKLKEEC